ncbi:MAG TPA: hypothetical protein VGG74_03455 [Kofleriaceae bacterium]|jgi:hypothetical protein
MKRAFVLGFLTACGTHGAMRVDSPATPYVAPDIGDITGIDDDDSGDDTGSAAVAPAPAPAATTAPAAGPAPAPRPAGK